MNEINLGRILLANRRKRGITQDQLAEYMGVSKAAVSKWETGTTYPDIFMLPRLAAYFDLTIDELMGYEPQMEQAEIRRWHRILAEEFAELPFEKALNHCQEMARKYYSCYPFLFHIGSLLANHFMLAEDPERSGQILEEAKSLFIRIKQNTDDPNLGKEALLMEAWCLLTLRRPREALDLLETDTAFSYPAEPLLASAYQMSGNEKQAREVLQSGIYKELCSLLNLMQCYMDFCSGSERLFKETCSRIRSLSAAFSLESLLPGQFLPCFLSMARGWVHLGDTEKALHALKKYTDLAAGDIYPLRLHGDSYFDLLDDWLENVLDLGTFPPRNEAVIRRSMTQALTEDPAFSDLSKDPRFQELVSRLKKNETIKEEN